MSRISTRFEQLRAAHRTALIPFITAGDPRPETTVELMHAMVAAGADLIELGVPFSDPIADGPVIQRATERALARGVSLSDVLEMVRQFRERDADTPVVAMGYLNPIEVMGYGRFARAAAAAGLDGALIVDVPPEEGHELVQALRTESVDLVYLLAPTSTERRISRIGEVASGFVYYVSVKGVTGAANLDVDEVAAKVETIRARIPLPVGVGFGIKDGETAARVAAVADAVIVGSAIVKQIEALAETPEAIAPTIGDFIAELRGAIDAADAAANRPEQVTS
ncbi:MULTISPECIES: tryptophan synthase subunit alpha [unclassified Marichromatium]|uniref:tryptophan synthase subunit alpha n=1 Tax=unclassified Marichromatium TaxID=2618417 RepID=UPI000F3BA1F2|nr:tryptophan synthase subunit alpha [Marichromatium sp. AB32]MBO8086728.1 tryptophan synthase subunit alpha [Marichromatium sp.]RNE94762.1 tryptophan synthase subunit alpha [Marichromatium sp. AB32]